MARLFSKSNKKKSNSEVSSLNSKSNIMPSLDQGKLNHQLEHKSGNNYQNHDDDSNYVINYDLISSTKIDSNFDSTHNFHGYNHSPLINQTKSMASTPWLRFKLLNSPFPRYRHAASSIASDKHELFLMGGLKEGSVFGDTWKITPKIEKHQITNYEANIIDIVNMQTPPARVGHAAVLCGNAFIIYGGDTVDTDIDGFPDNNFYLFNINNNKYTIPSHILSKPNGRYGHTLQVISLNNNSSKLYLFGGQLENQVYNDLYCFELNTFKSSKAKWEIIEPANNFKPPPLTNHSMAVYKSKLYVFGGVYNNEKVSNDLWTFDAITNKWQQIPTSGALPPATNEHSCCVANDKLYIYGGNDFSGVIYSSLYVLDLNTNVWSKLIDEGAIDGPGPRCGHTMTFIPKYNKIVIMGGDKNDYVSDDPQDFDTYDTYLGTENGTMIYQLDVDIIDRFLTDQPTIIKSNSKKAASAKNSDYYKNHARSLSGNVGNTEEFTSAAASPLIKPTANLPEVNLDQSPSRNIVSENDEDTKALRKSLDPLVSSSANENPYSSIARGVSVDGGALGGVAALIHSENQANNRNISNNPEFVDVTSIKDGTNTPDHHRFASDLRHSSDLQSNFNGKPSQEYAGSGEKELTGGNGQIAPVSNGITRQQTTPDGVKQLIDELTSELTRLKSSTKTQMQQASEKISQLEEENQKLISNHEKELVPLREQVQEKDDVINSLKAAIDPKELVIDENSSTQSLVPELGKYKLERMELNNRVLHLQQENLSLKQKQEEFEPFMNNQIGELSKFQKIIESQEEKITQLTNQLLDQQELTKELNEWKAKHENLQLEFENYKTITKDEIIEDDTEVNTSNHSDSRSIVSGLRSKREISGQLESLVTAWQARQAPGGLTHDIPGSFNDNQQQQKQVINQLQKQIDDLLRISKENDIQSSNEIKQLRLELEEKLISLKTIEEKYRDALQSVNNTSKALKLNQEELESQKVSLEKLMKENNELKIFKKANKRVSSRDGTPLVEGDATFPATIQEGDEDDEITNAHYNMKVKDLEADLYIIKQERDQLKQSVTSLQKQLYLTSQES